MTITDERYKELLIAEMKLIALEGVGVRQWEGYEAMEELLNEVLSSFKGRCPA